jgi:hypothetical protein
MASGGGGEATSGTQTGAGVDAIWASFVIPAGIPPAPERSSILAFAGATIRER